MLCWLQGGVPLTTDKYTAHSHCCFHLFIYLFLANPCIYFLHPSCQILKLCSVNISSLCLSVISMIISKYLDHIWFYNRGVCFFCNCFSICILQCSDYVDVSVLSIKVWDKNEFKVIASYQGRH